MKRNNYFAFETKKLLRFIEGNKKLFLFGRSSLLGLLLCELSLELGLHHVHDGLADGALLVADRLNEKNKNIYFLSAAEMREKDITEMKQKKFR